MNPRASRGSGIVEEHFCPPGMGQADGTQKRKWAVTYHVKNATIMEAEEIRGMDGYAAP